MGVKTKEEVFFRRTVDLRIYWNFFGEEKTMGETELEYTWRLVREKMLHFAFVSFGNTDKNDPRCQHIATTRKDFLTTARLGNLVTDHEDAVLSDAWGEDPLSRWHYLWERSLV